jgi:undecaprenyl-diphosphatase
MEQFMVFSAEYLYVLSVLIAGIFFFISHYEIKKKMAILALLSLPLAFIFSLGARELVNNPRPFVVGEFEPLIPHEADNGFPSDHTLLVAAIASVITFFQKRTALCLWLIAGIVALARVYVGVHHLSDVLASIGIALLSAYLVHKALKHKEVL